MTQRQLVALFAVHAAAAASLGLALADREAHRTDPAYGVNQWGYRDEARARKEPDETRVAIVGGSAAFEAGTAVSETMASNLFFVLREGGAPKKQTYHVVNLSAPRVGPDSYIDTIRHYAFLNPDVICLFDGYDTLEGLPPHAREHSAVFRKVGYLPLLPARLLSRPGWMSDPDGGIANVLQDGPGGAADTSCAGVSAQYCRTLSDVVRFGLQQRYQVIVVSPPTVSERHGIQQRSLGESLEREFGGDRRFKYLDLGSVVDLAKRDASPDGIHRSRDADHVVGQHIAWEILKF